MPGSPPPSLAAIVMAWASFVKAAPRFASAAPFFRFIVDHLECPDINPQSPATAVFSRKRPGKTVVRHHPSTRLRDRSTLDISPQTCYSHIIS